MSTHPGVAPAKVIRRRGQTVLSPRKVDVLRLVSAGASNPETAETLVISINTVTRRVTNIYRKTGTENRVEATRYAIVRGLTE